MDHPTDPFSKLMRGETKDVTLEDFTKNFFTLKTRGDMRVLLTPGVAASVMGKGWSFSTKVMVPAVELSKLPEAEIDKLVDRAIAECKKFQTEVPTYMGGTKKVTPKPIKIGTEPEMEGTIMLNLVKEGRLTAQVSTGTMLFPGEVSNADAYMKAFTDAVRRLLVRGEIINKSASRGPCTDPDCKRHRAHYGYITRKGFEIWKDRLWREFQPANKKSGRYGAPNVLREVWEAKMLEAIDTMDKSIYKDKFSLK